MDNRPCIRDCATWLRRATIGLAALVALLMPSLPAIAGYGGDSPDIDDLIDRIDRIFRSQTSRSTVRMAIENPNWSRTLDMEFWTEGLDKTFVLITSPKKDAGIATLRVDNEMWNFFPKINKVMKVPPSMMMSSWMGSDFTNDDLVKESSMRKDYDARLLPDQGDKEHIHVEFIPRENTPIVWGRIVVKVRRTDYIPVREDFYDENGVHKRIMLLSDIRKLGGRTVPCVMELVPVDKEGHRTVITYLDAEFDAPLGADVFTLRNLRKER